MATYTFAYKSKCGAPINPHMVFDIKRNTKVIKTITIDPGELRKVDIDVLELSNMLIKLALKAANPATMTEARTAIESIQVII